MFNCIDWNQSYRLIKLGRNVTLSFAFKTYMYTLYINMEVVCAYLVAPKRTNTIKVFQSPMKHVTHRQKTTILKTKQQWNSVQYNDTAKPYLKQNSKETVYDTTIQPNHT